MKEAIQVDEKVDTKLVDQIIKWICEGKSKGYIIQKLTKGKPEKDQESIEYAIKLIKEAISQLNEICNLPASETSKFHIEHYEKIYDYFKNIRHTQGANKALKAKERLKRIFQMPKMTINQNIQTTISNSLKYDISKLSEKQRTRMQFLLNKAKV